MVILGSGDWVYESYFREMRDRYPEDVYKRQVEERALKKKRKFAIIAVAEGSMTQEEAQMKGKVRKELRAQESYMSISYRIADQLQQATGLEARVVVQGHFQRGGSPSCLLYTSFAGGVGEGIRAAE